MNIILIENGATCCLAFTGSLTQEFVHEMEDQIIDALRRYCFFEIDLSGVQEIDVFGIHLLGVLHTFGGGGVHVVKTSNVVLRAYERLAPQRGAWLCGSPEERALGAAGPATR